MAPSTKPLSFGLFLLLLLSLFPQQSLSLNTDGTLLLAFRYSILSDPLSLLQNWLYSDLTPCSWFGVTCDPTGSRVTRLNLPNSRLLGSLVPELGLLDQLQRLDLSGNSFNGSLPTTLFNSSTNLQTLSLANNVLSGEIPPSITAITTLNYLNLSGNHFSGDLPRGLGSVEVLDFSSNFFNGSLPSDIGGPNLRFLSVSRNNLSGGLAPDLGSLWPENVTVYLSFNNLTGQIPEVKALVEQYWALHF